MSETSTVPMSAMKTADEKLKKKLFLKESNMLCSRVGTVIEQGFSDGCAIKNLIQPSCKKPCRFHI